MSTLKVTNIENPNGGGVSAKIADVGGGQLSNRNLIVNGAMRVAQRATQATGKTTSNYYTCDRVRMVLSNLGTWTLDQASDGPPGFTKSFKATCTTADASPAAADLAYVQYRMEAQNFQHLNFGTSDAVAMTLSFWVKSNKTGAASFMLYQNDNSVRLFSTSYTISAADTWEYKTIAIPADTSGLINDDNGIGLTMAFWLNSGSDSTGGSYNTTWGTYAAANTNVNNLGVGGAVSDNYAITGIQLEVGSVATTFEHRSFGDELARCQRYYQRINGDASDQTMVCPVACHSNNASGDDFRGVYTFPVEMRADASMSFNDLLILHSSGDLAVTSGTSLDSSPYSVGLDMDTAATAPSTNQMAILRLNNATTSYIDFSAEL